MLRIVIDHYEQANNGDHQSSQGEEHTNLDKQERHVGLSVYPSISGSILIELSDNGPGIDESLMDKIFVPFFTTKEGGNGIGLSLSRQLARQLNMRLSVHSKLGRGTTFQLEL